MIEGCKNHLLILQEEMHMPDSDLDLIKGCSDDDEKRECLHSLSKERLVEMIIRITRKAQ